MYRIYNFNGVSLPFYNPTTEWQTPPIRSPFVSTASGVYDQYGTDRAQYDFPYTLSYTATALDKTNLATLRGALDNLRAQVGNDGLLWRVADDDDTNIHWTNARLMSAPSVRTVANQRHQEISLEFAVKQHWRREQQWRFDSGVNFDDGRVFSEGAQKFTLSGTANPFNGRTETNFSVAVGGEVPIEDAFIQIEAGSTSYTEFNLWAPNQTADGKVWSMHFERPGEDVLPAGSTLTINCATFTIDIDGQPAYDALKLIPHQLYNFTHQLRGWTWFSPDVFNGNTTVVFDTGGTIGVDTVITVLLYDQWL